MQLHPTYHAARNPSRAAVIMGSSGRVVTYGELDAASNRFAHLMRARGVQIGDTIAMCLENTADLFTVAWGAQRAGLVYVAISERLAAPEIAYILRDSGSRLVVGSGHTAALLDEAAGLVPGVAQLRFGGGLEAELAAMPDTPVADERAGCDMLYSSGTTGRPKGVRIPLPEDTAIGAVNSLVGLASQAFGIGADAVYLSPAPLYHAAPLR